MLALAAPIIVIASVIIKVSSAGPVLYKQHRVGKHSRIFTLYKFRTMVNDAEKIWGFTPATQDDERVTSIGRFLRRTRMDEIPQLVNVLKGEMSLVGPRPENLYRVNMHASLRGPRLLVKPGLTGLAQIRAFYDLKPEHKIKYDYLYIQKRSFFLNTYILLKTIPVVLLKKGW
jgi:lipopolysaccharide/colanic/teichoic acid biosynthesis glycosyltransferase